tara:strand:+ start:387 stop:674 length:288 start_codon:yes stop_codon:yes gene_type:complete
MRWEGPKAAEYQGPPWQTGKGRFVVSNADLQQVHPHIQNEEKKTMESLFHDHKITLNDSIGSSIGNWKTKWLLLRNVFENGDVIDWSRMESLSMI